MRFLKMPLLFLCGLLLFSGSALALPLVGGVDKLISSDNVHNGYWSELDWIENELPSPVNFPEANKYNTTGQWTEVNGYYALELKYMPQYYYIKIGTGGTNIEWDHFLYENVDDLNWAVVDPTEWFNNNIVSVQFSLQGGLPRNIDTQRISAIGEVNPTPEPATMLLLGSGLAL